MILKFGEIQTIQQQSKPLSSKEAHGSFVKWKWNDINFSYWNGTSWETKFEVNQTKMVFRSDMSYF